MKPVRSFATGRFCTFPWPGRGGKNFILESRQFIKIDNTLVGCNLVAIPLRMDSSSDFSRESVGRVWETHVKWEKIGLAPFFTSVTNPSIQV